MYETTVLKNSRTYAWPYLSLILKARQVPVHGSALDRKRERAVFGIRLGWVTERKFTYYARYY